MSKNKFPKASNDGNDAASNLIRTKVDKAYQLEPDADLEKKEIQLTGAHSKHQLYMQKLLKSGKSYLDIQAAWHSYYLSLSDEEKHEVWREFYSAENRSQSLATNDYTQNNDYHNPKKVTGGEDSPDPKNKAPQKEKTKTVADIKHDIAKKVSADGKLTARHHVKSLLFGLGMAMIFALLSGFTLFNQLFIGPFITPSINATASPTIIPTNSTIAVSPETKIIIPKLNVEAPIVTDAKDNSEDEIQKSLQKGVVLYPNTGVPGELGNQVIFGHSANNLFNKGDYKYVFVLLSKLENGDIVYINYQSKQYTYKVINKKIIKPTEVGVLSEQPVPSLITLITCDPPGANVNRLVVQAEQIDPKPETNKPSSAKADTSSEQILPGSPESLWKRLINYFF